MAWAAHEFDNYLVEGLVLIVRIRRTPTGEGASFEVRLLPHKWTYTPACLNRRHPLVEKFYEGAPTLCWHHGSH
jgi:hypothetical protein